MPALTVLAASCVLMVSSMHPPLGQLSDDNIKALNATPFDGVAVDVIGPYDGSPLPDEAALRKHCEHVRGVSTKAIWPRVYGNRTVELSPKIKARNASRTPAYFEAIRGMDIHDTAGALGDFYRLCRMSLKMARTLGAPGIVFDLEVYNHSDGYRVQWIADRQGRTPAEVIARLKAIGAQVADITGEEFPHAVLWSLFTTLNRPAQYREPGGNYYTAPAYVFMGLLERAAEKRIPLRLVSGGEWGGYCYKSVEAMRERFATRNAGFQP